LLEEWLQGVEGLERAHPFGSEVEAFVAQEETR